MAFVNFEKSCDVFSTLVPSTGSDSMAPLKLQRLSVLVALKVRRDFLFLFPPLLLCPPLWLLLLLLLLRLDPLLLLLLEVVSGVGDAVLFALLSVML